MATHSAGKYLEALTNLNTYFLFVKWFSDSDKTSLFFSSALSPSLL